MNLSLVSSFVIGTIILLALVKVNLRLAENSMDSMNDQVAKVHVNDVAPILNYDFRKIGYGTTEGLLEANSTKITFKGDLDDDGIVDLVSWEYDKTQPVTGTSNPNDYALIRTVNGNAKPIKLGVTKFILSYYDELNQPTALLNNIRKMKEKLICESSVKVDQKYMVAFWEKTFVPLSITK